MTTTNQEEPMFTCAHCHEGNHTKAMIERCSVRKEKGLASRKFALLLIEMAEERNLPVDDEAKKRAFNLTVEEAKAKFERLRATRRPRTEVVHHDDAEVTCGYCSHFPTPEEAEERESGAKIQVKATLAHVREHAAQVAKERAAEQAKAEAKVAEVKAEVEGEVSA
jgi:hypothetical protein